MEFLIFSIRSRITERQKAGGPIGAPSKIKPSEEEGMSGGRGDGKS